jgi:hypothetical protein
MFGAAPRATPAQPANPAPPGLFKATPHGRSRIHRPYESLEIVEILSDDLQDLIRINFGVTMHDKVAQARGPGQALTESRRDSTSAHQQHEGFCRTGRRTHAMIDSGVDCEIDTALDCPLEIHQYSVQEIFVTAQRCHRQPGATRQPCAVVQHLA